MSRRAQRASRMHGQLEMRRAQLSLARADMLSARQQVESALKLIGYGTDKPERSVRCLTNGLSANHPLTREAQDTLAKLSG